MSGDNLLIYLFRRDLRISDNPILHHLASTTTDHGFTHILPVFVFHAHQMETSGFITDGSPSPYPEARSQLAKYWRCGPHRAKFTGEAVWNLKENLDALGSGLALRVGLPAETIEELLVGLQEKQHKVGAVWMIGEEGVEEKRDERALEAVCTKHGVDLNVWVDEKYFVDDRDLAVKDLTDLPKVFTEYRKRMDPLREKARKPLPVPTATSLPRLLDLSRIPQQSAPFSIPASRAELVQALVGPVKQFLSDVPPFPENTASAHPFEGGEDAARLRLQDAIRAETMLKYKDTRNGLLGVEFSTKLSAFLAQGCITSRQINEAMKSYEDGTDETYQDVTGYGQGENQGTLQVRIELLWRDYNRLCARDAKHKLFRLGGIRVGETYGDGANTNSSSNNNNSNSNSNNNNSGSGGGGGGSSKWKTPVKEEASPQQDPKPEAIARIIERFNAGTTGMGLIDASQRELIHSGYTSNRARQNVAGFLAKHLGIDWRYGAEWYEMLLVDYDVSSNWANWQYVSGVGNDPRSTARIFNPVKQAFDYDPEGAYVRAWVPELRGLEKLENLFQAWTASHQELSQLGLADNEMVTDPVKRIEFSVEGKPKNARRPYIRRPHGPRRPTAHNDTTSATTAPPPSSSDTAAATATAPSDGTTPAAAAAAAAATSTPNHHRFPGQGRYRSGGGNYYRGMSRRGGGGSPYRARGGGYRGGYGGGYGGGYPGGYGGYGGGLPQQQPSWGYAGGSTGRGNNQGS